MTRIVACVGGMILFLVGCVAPTTGTSGRVRTDVPDQARRELLLLATEPKPRTTPSVHVVAAGESLYGISRNYGVPVGDLLAANPAIKGPSQLQIGTRLTIPASGEGPAPAPPMQPPIEPLAGENEGGVVGERVIVAPLPPRSREGYIWPARGRIVTEFGAVVPGGGGVHSLGIALAVAPRSRVLAVKAGRAYRAEHVPGMGKAIMVVHDDGVVTFYGNNTRLLPRHGARVEQGEVIAVAGTEPVFFMVLRNGTPVNPVPYLP